MQSFNYTAPMPASPSAAHRGYVRRLAGDGNTKMKTFCISIVLILCAIVASAQIITTYAAVQSYNCTFDKFGNLYISQYLGHTIKKVNTLGIISTVAGTGMIGYSGDGGLATNAMLKFPDGLACDSVGNLFISDRQNYRIRKVTLATGIITTYAGSGIIGDSGDGSHATAAKFFPTGICIDKYNNLFISDNTYHKIKKVDATTGIITTYAGTGTPGFTGDGGQATLAQLNSPAYIAIDMYGNLYISDAQNKRIRKVDASGIITTVGGTGIALYSGEATSATATNMGPLAIAIDNRQNIYYGDSTLRVRKIDAAGYVHTIVGTGSMGYNGDGIPATSALISSPGGITIDTCGNVYFADISNNRIRKVTFNPPPCTYLSVNEQSVNKEVSIYPNPTNDELHIENAQPHTTYQLYNIVGAVVQGGLIENSSSIINIKYLPPGLYLLALTDEDGKRTVHKIVKE